MKRTTDNSAAFEAYAEMFDKWSQDPNHERLMREDEKMREVLAKHLPTESVPPPRERPKPFGAPLVGDFAHLARVFRALGKDAPPEGTGLLARALSLYLQDTEDPEMCQFLQDHYPEIYQGYLDSAKRHAHCQAPATVAIVEGEVN